MTYFSNADLTVDGARGAAFRTLKLLVLNSEATFVPQMVRAELALGVAKVAAAAEREFKNTRAAQATTTPTQRRQGARLHTSYSNVLAAAQEKRWSQQDIYGLKTSADMAREKEQTMARPAVPESAPATEARRLSRLTHQLTDDPERT